MGLPIYHVLFSTLCIVVFSQWLVICSADGSKHQVVVEQQPARIDGKRLRNDIGHPSFDGDGNSLKRFKADSEEGPADDYDDGGVQTKRSKEDLGKGGGNKRLPAELGKRLKSFRLDMERGSSVDNSKRSRAEREKRSDEFGEFGMSERHTETSHHKRHNFALGKRSQALNDLSQENVENGVISNENDMFQTYGNKRSSANTAVFRYPEENKASFSDETVERPEDGLISRQKRNIESTEFIEDPDSTDEGKRANWDLGKRANWDLGKRANWDLGKRANWDLGKRANWDLGKRANWDLGKRANWDLGKRANWDLGKRANWDLGKRANWDLGKRANWDLGKRANWDLGKRANWDLGKRANWDLGKRANWDLGKRANRDLGKRANWDLGKRANWDLGKRENWDLGKRANWDLGKRANWDLGKRANWDLGKRANWDLGKRANWDLGKRASLDDEKRANWDLGKRANWDLGKRSDAMADSDDYLLYQDANGKHALDIAKRSSSEAGASKSVALDTDLDKRGYFGWKRPYRVDLGR